MKKILHLLTAIAMGGSTLICTMPITYQQRGYVAIGGEHLLAVFVAVSVYLIAKKI